MSLHVRQASMRRLLAAILAAGMAAAIGNDASAELCGAWNVIESPNPGGGNRGLYSLANTSPTNVMALGHSGAGPFAIRWTGSTWEEVAYPDLSGIGLIWGPDAVGADGAGNLWVAGLVSLSPGHPDPTMIRWTGSEWDRIESCELAPQTVWPFNDRNGSAADVWGHAEDDVWAVGISNGFGDGDLSTVGMIVHWDGSEWTEMIPPSVSNDVHRLFGVSGTGPHDVWAVGGARNTTGGMFALIYHWDGSSWSHVPSPAENLYDTPLRDVVALAPDDAWAVGDVGIEALIMHWDGSEWSIVENPLPEFTTMGPMDAISADDIWAVSMSTMVPIVPTFLHYDGVDWTAVDAPDVPEADGGVTVGGGLTVAGPCDVWAVGSYTAGGWNSTLTMRLEPEMVAAVGDPVGSAHWFRVAPNPTRLGTRIAIRNLGHRARVRLFDVRGRWVRDLFDGSVDGHVEIDWDRRDSTGKPVAGGVYFIHAFTETGAHTAKIVVE